MYLQLCVHPGLCCWFFQELTPCREGAGDHRVLKNTHPTPDCIDRLDGGQDARGGPDEAGHASQG